jgi:hypothetical protein
LESRSWKEETLNYVEFRVNAFSAAVRNQVASQGHPRGKQSWLMRFRFVRIGRIKVAPRFTAFTASWTRPFKEASFFWQPTDGESGRVCFY